MTRSITIGVAAISLTALLAGCGGGGGGATTDPLPSTVALYDGSSRAPLDSRVLLDRARSADFVLLGEVHDNPVHHETRARILTALAELHPAVVFEQFRAADGPIPAPPSGNPDDAWLDQYGFDRAGWRWPLHRPVVVAAIAHGRSIWGSNLSRESLVGAVRNGESALPDALRKVMAQAPLDAAAQALMDQELIDGHCGQLPASMVGGMRTAQVARDASMASVMMTASASGPAWLIAGNGHVRGDVSVPRILRVIAPGKTVLAVGLLESPTAGGLPPDDAWTGYDLVLVTPRVDRPDPCASLRRSRR